MCVIALFPPRYLLGCESHNRLPHRTSATTVTPVICLCRPPTIGYWKSESALHEDARSLSYWYIIIIVHAHVDSLPPYFPHRHLPNPLTIRSLLCLPFSPDLRHAIFTPPFEMLIDSPPFRAASLTPSHSPGSRPTRMLSSARVLALHSLLETAHVAFSVSALLRLLHYRGETFSPHPRISIFNIQC